MSIADFAALVPTSWVSTKDPKNTLDEVFCVGGCHYLLQMSKVCMSMAVWRRAVKSLLNE